MAELRDQIADMLYENDLCGSGPVSRQEYLADADAILALAGERVRLLEETLRELLDHLDENGPYDSGIVSAPSTKAIRQRGRNLLDAALAATRETMPEPNWRQQDGGAVGKELRAELERERLHRGDVQVAREATARERDEAREALRELADAVSDVAWSESTYDHERAVTARRRLNAARSWAAHVLEGVERTHALVPIAALAWMADNIGGHGMRAQLRDLFAAASRGERVEWPS